MAKRNRSILGKNDRRDMCGDWVQIQKLLARLVEKDVLTEDERREVFSHALRQLKAEAGYTRDEAVVAAENH